MDEILSTLWEFIINNKEITIGVVVAIIEALLRQNKTTKSWSIFSSLIPRLLDLIIPDKSKDGGKFVNERKNKQ